MLILATAISAQTKHVPFHRKGSNIVVEVTVDRAMRHFLLDTGSGVTVLSPDTAGRSAVDVKTTAGARRLGVQLDGTTHSMGSGTATLEFGHTMIVTPVAVADLTALSKALNVKLDGVLGQDVLSQFARVTIDYRNRQLILEK